MGYGKSLLVAQEVRSDFHRKAGDMALKLDAIEKQRMLVHEVMSRMEHTEEIRVFTPPNNLPRMVLCEVIR